MLKLKLLCHQLPHTIQALASKGDLVFAAVRGDIIACKRMHRCGCQTVLLVAITK